MSIRAVLGEAEYQSLLERCVTIGKDGRLSRQLAQKPLRIAFLGGSVTYGYRPSVADAKGCFPELVEQALAMVRGYDGVCCRNYGVSGTDSVVGGLLAERHLHSFAPHIVFVEYAINESFNRLSVEKVDGLVKKLLGLPGRPAVVLISVVNQPGYSCEAFFEEIALRHGLSLIGLRRSLYPLVESGTLPWEAYSEDGGHPHAHGHRFLADAVLHLLSCAAESENMGEQSDEIQGGNAFAALRPVPPEQVSAAGFVYTDYPLYHFPSAWSALRGGAAELETELFCSTIVLVFVQDNAADWASVAVEIDGKQAELLQGQSMFGWHNPVCRIVLHEKSAARHRLKIRRLSEDSGKQFLLQEIGADYQ